MAISNRLHSFVTFICNMNILSDKNNFISLHHITISKPPTNHSIKRISDCLEADDLGVQRVRGIIDSSACTADLHRFLLAGARHTVLRSHVGACSRREEIMTASSETVTETENIAQALAVFQLKVHDLNHQYQQQFPMQTKHTKTLTAVGVVCVGSLEADVALLAVVGVPRVAHHLLRTGNMFINCGIYK